MARLTVHTATYNRAYILENAYNSLKKQTNKDFEWIITDDGSADNTQELVESWMAEDNGFEIVYNRLSHVGIPRALNSGVKLASTDWFMMLDSDDYILPETIEKVLGWISDIAEDTTLAGIGFARCFPNGEFMKDQIPVIDSQRGYVDATHIERKKYKLDMDMCEVHRTKLLREYPFRYYGEEKYAPEQLNFYEIALAGYKLRWRAEKLYICEYLPDGQTKDDHLVKNNPMGFAMMYDQNALITPRWSQKCKNTVRMTALCLYARKPGYITRCNYRGLAILTFPAAFILFMRRRRQYAKLK